MTTRSQVIGAQKLQAAMQAAPERLARGIKLALNNAGSRWQGEMTTRTRTVLKRRTGRLAGSITHKVSGSDLKSLELRAATTSPYAKVHEHGTKGKGGKLPDITAKNGKYLTIPIRDNLTGGGDVRFKSAAALRATGKTFVLRTSDGPNGRAYIVLKQGDDLKFLWMLKRSVSIPARLGFFATWRAGAKDRRKDLEKVVNIVLTGKVA